MWREKEEDSDYLLRIALPLWLQAIQMVWKQRECKKQTSLMRKLEGNYYINSW
jgi:hypothetical protein